MPVDRRRVPSVATMRRLAVAALLALLAPAILFAILYMFQDCKRVGHETLYCILTVMR